MRLEIIIFFLKSISETNAGSWKNRKIKRPSLENGFASFLSPHLPAIQKYSNKNAHPVKKENIKPSAAGCEPSV